MKMDERSLAADLCLCIGFTLSHMLQLTQNILAKASSSTVSMHSDFRVTWTSRPITAVNVAAPIIAFLTSVPEGDIAGVSLPHLQV